MDDQTVSLGQAPKTVANTADPIQQFKSAKHCKHEQLESKQASTP